MVLFKFLKNKKLLFIGFCSIIIFFILLFLPLMDVRAVYILGIGEFSFAEICTDMAYLGSVVFVLKKRCIVNFRIKVIFIFICFSLLMEESSWLQKYLNYNTPNFVGVRNTQDEVSIHNLYFIQSYSILDKMKINGNFSLFYINLQNLFAIMVLFYFIVLPSVVRYIGLGVSNKYFIPLELKYSYLLSIPLTISYAITISYSEVVYLRGAAAEIRELLYSFYFLSYSIQLSSRPCKNSETRTNVRNLG